MELNKTSLKFYEKIEIYCERLKRIEFYPCYFLKHYRRLSIECFNAKGLEVQVQNFQNIDRLKHVEVMALKSENVFSEQQFISEISYFEGIEHRNQRENLKIVLQS